MRVFGRSVSFAEIYTDNKNVRNLRVALRSDSDVIVKGDEVSTRYQKLSNAGMLELYYGYLINPDNLAYVQIKDKEIKLSFEGKEGTKVLTPHSKGKVNKVNPYRAELPAADFNAMKDALRAMQGEVLDSIDNIQDAVEDLTLQVVNLENAALSVNAGLASGSLQVNSIQVG